MVGFEGGCANRGEPHSGQGGTEEIRREIGARCHRQYGLIGDSHASHYPRPEGGVDPGTQQPAGPNFAWRPAERDIRHQAAAEFEQEQVEEKEEKRPCCASQDCCHG